MVGSDEDDRIEEEKATFYIVTTTVFNELIGHEELYYIPIIMKPS